LLLDRSQIIPCGISKGIDNGISGACNMKWLTVIIEGFNTVKKLPKSLVINIKLDKELNWQEYTHFLMTYMKAGRKGHWISFNIKYSITSITFEWRGHLSG